MLGWRLKARSSRCTITKDSPRRPPLYKLCRSCPTCTGIEHKTLTPKASLLADHSLGLYSVRVPGMSTTLAPVTLLRAIYVTGVTPIPLTIQPGATMRVASSDPITLQNSSSSFK
jgi:hypothetical protein